MALHQINRGRRWTAAAAAVLALTGAPVAYAGMDAYIGEMMLFAGNFCPRGTLEANGAILPVASYVALFSILGTMYGGDGVSNFALPDLRSRVPVGVGQGPGLSNVELGQKGGLETVSLLSINLPAHSHTVSSPVASDKPASYSTPAADRVLAQTQNAGAYVAVADANTTLAPSGNGSTGLTGSNIPVPVRDPYLGMMWCITTAGIFPPRP